MTDDIQEDQMIHETPGATPNFRTELAAQLAELVPEAIADGKVDVAKLKELLDGDVGDESERFGLFWPGKRKAMRAAQEPTTATLRPDKENSKDWDTTQNVFIEGDNLEVLKILQKHYHNKIKMIYIDPPYNTGVDFIYPDDFTEGLAKYLEWTNQVSEEGFRLSTNAEAEGRFHSNWLNMMYPRLKLARNLLRDDGVIIVSIDDNEAQNLIKLMNEIFGENNFVAQIPWRKRTAKSDVPFGVSQDFEWLIMYARSSLFKARVKGKGRKYYESGDFPGRRWRIHDLTTQRTASERPKSNFTLVNPKNGEEFPANPDATWRVTVDTFDQYYEQNKIVFPGDYDFLNISRPVMRYFEDEDKKKDGDNFGFVALSTLLPTSVGMTKEGTKELAELFGEKLFSFPKPTSLIAFLVEVCTSDNDIVLDFFAGSGTAAQAVLEVNSSDLGRRSYMLVQLPEPTEKTSAANKAGFETIASLARKRIELASKKIETDFESDAGKSGNPIDFGFRYFVLSDTNFSKWRESSDISRDELEQRLFELRESASDSASPDDLLSEVLLKQGYSLTERLLVKNISGLDCRIVGENLVIAYLDEKVKPTLDQLRAMVDQDPQRIIMLEDAFQGDDELKTNLAQLCKSKGIELWTA